MLDEIDKLGRDYRGDPASAVLEILDPAQNSPVPRQLSRSAVRSVEGVLHHDGEQPRHDSPAAAGPHGNLRLSGYSEEEKVQIAQRYLLPRR